MGRAAALPIDLRGWLDGWLEGDRLEGKWLNCPHSHCWNANSPPPLASSVRRAPHWETKVLFIVMKSKKKMCVIKHTEAPQHCFLSLLPWSYQTGNFLIIWHYLFCFCAIKKNGHLTERLYQSSARGQTDRQMKGHESCRKGGRWKS